MNFLGLKKINFPQKTELFELFGAQNVQKVQCFFGKLNFLSPKKFQKFSVDLFSIFLFFVSQKSLVFWDLFSKQRSLTLDVQKKSKYWLHLFQYSFFFNSFHHKNSNE